MSHRAKKVSEIVEMMQKPHSIRNIGLVGHIDHGKTTLSDSLLCEAGLLSPNLAGEARVLDFLEEEQRRGITMKSANISLYYQKSLEEPFLINLVDTPGHLDFSGKVTRALRLIDGVLVIVDAVEEVSSQSETVVRQALNEGVKPLLFINKIDRLIREIKLDAAEIQEKLNRIIQRFNGLVEMYGTAPYDQDWQVRPERGEVLFGSALHRWAFSMPQVLAKQLSFQTVIDKYLEDNWTPLQAIFPVHEAVLRAVVDLLPDPVTAQSYRIPKIWDGDATTPLGQAMKECAAGEEAPLVMCFSKVQIEKHGLVATGRVFSGRLRRGCGVYLVRDQLEDKIQQVSIYMGSRRDQTDEIPAGNIAAITGLNSIRSGETIVATPHHEAMVPFEQVQYVSDPVMTVAIEPDKLRDFSKLHRILEEVLIEDPNLALVESKETGEVLLSGMGPLHLEVVAQQIQERGLGVTVSKPIPVFKESISGTGPVVEVSSMNRRNRVQLGVSRLASAAVACFRDEGISPGQVDEKTRGILTKRAALPPDETDRLVYLDPNMNCVFLDQDFTDDVESIDPRVLAKVYDVIAAICLEGPLCKEPLRELAIHIPRLTVSGRGEARNEGELSPMFRKAIHDSIRGAQAVLLEPIYKMEIQVPAEFIGNITAITGQFQGKVLRIGQHEQHTTVVLLIPVRQSLDFVELLRSKTSGRAFWQYQFDSFQEVPGNLQNQLVEDINFRKGALVEEISEELSLSEINFDEP